MQINIPKEIDLVVKLTAQEIHEAFDDAEDAYTFHHNILYLVNEKTRDANAYLYALIKKVFEENEVDDLGGLITFCQTGHFSDEKK